MNDCITIRHELSCFSVTKEPELVTSKTGKEIYVTRGISTAAPGPSGCPVCGSAMHRHGKREMKIQDIDLLGHLATGIRNTSSSRSNSLQWEVPINSNPTPFCKDPKISILFAGFVKRITWTLELVRHRRSGRIWRAWSTSHIYSIENL